MALSKLEQIVAAVMARVVPLYPAAPAVGSLEFSVGKISASAQDAPPRVLWVPTGDTFEGPTKTSLGQMTVRALRTRVVGLDAYCWADDFAGAELLFEQVTSAMHAECVGSYDLARGQWPTEDDAQWLTRGEAYIASFTVKIPVPDRTNTTVVVTAAALTPTGATPGDGVLQAGETP